ncbi:MAG: NADH:ubiquinone reductase (Na(+)-transporting) subunit C [Muribaculaceae bacterium]
MNKQSNTYTIIYSAVMVVIVGTVLAFTYLALKPLQDKNIATDKMKQILSSVHISTTPDDILSTYSKYIIESYTIDSLNNRIDVKAFDVNIASQSKISGEKRQLPVFVCRLDDGSLKYILPTYGAGLWGPIWGYVAIDANGDTVYGAYFAHQGETPGLGAEIDKPVFQGQFRNLNLFKEGEFKSIAVEKKGQKPVDGADYVDAVSGGTITSKGVQSMLAHSLRSYNIFLKSLQKAPLK